jgi:hypothetical protein
MGWLLCTFVSHHFDIVLRYCLIKALYRVLTKSGHSNEETPAKLNRDDVALRGL